MQKVLVVFEAYLGKSIRFCNEVAEVGKYPLSGEEVTMFQEMIRDRHGFDDVNVINVIPLRSED